MLICLNACENVRLKCTPGFPLFRFLNMPLQIFVTMVTGWPETNFTYTVISIAFCRGNCQRTAQAEQTTTGEADEATKSIRALMIL